MQLLKYYTMIRFCSFSAVGCDCFLFVVGEGWTEQVWGEGEKERRGEEKDKEEGNR